MALLMARASIAQAPSKAPAPAAPQAQDLGWPRQKISPDGKLIYYQPQFDQWTNFKNVQGRLAFQITPTGGQTTMGIADIVIQTDSDLQSHTVLLHDPQVLETHFPSVQDPAIRDQLDSLARSFLNPDATMTISLERMISVTEKPKVAAPSGLNQNPPTIFVSYVPSVLLIVDGQPVYSPIPETKLDFIPNANWPLFAYEKSKFYLLSGMQWLEAKELNGPWEKTDKVPKDFEKLAQDPGWDEVKQAVPAKKLSAPAPQVFYSQVPAEILLFKGPPIYARVPGTTLSFATNTDNDVFVHGATNSTYILIAGRWFRASSLQGPWTYASADLPDDFRQIPENSAPARVLSSVPGTPEAEDAVLLAQVPQTVTVNREQAASKISVTYAGAPEFKPIEGTQLSYAVNTQDKVIKVGDLYYLCFQAVWFVSTTPNGPWKTTDSVPKEIYSIPPSASVYNVTYVNQTVTSDGDLEASYTAGYLGMFVVGATVVYGSGWYYPPYYYGVGVVPIYYGYPATYGAVAGYNPYTGRYGVGGAAYGPYGGAGWGATYNPSTGTYARGATVSGPNGTRSVGQAYNPYTGAYAATRQGSSPYGQWGQTVTTRGNQAAVTSHVTTSQGTAGSIRTSNGGAAVGKTGPGGDAFAGKTANGDVYAGKDGNVYKRNSNGSWSQYQNGSWNNVNKPTSQSAQNSRPQSAQTQSLNQEWQNRSRGESQSQRFQQNERSNWGSRGGGFGGGGFGGGGFRGGGRR
jgi:hypothetical protein